MLPDAGVVNGVASAAVRVRPLELLTPDRLDLIVKHDFFRARLTGRDHGAEARYRRHIAHRTGGYEDGKRSVQDYVDSAARLLDDLRTHGFNPSSPVRIGAVNDRPLDGAHRLAAALALGIDVCVEHVPLKYGGTWDFEWFREHGFNREALERLLLGYALLCAQPGLFIFWGPSRPAWQQLTDVLQARMPVVGALDVACSADELAVIVDDIYAWTLGPLPNGRIRAKARLLADGPPCVRVVLADFGTAVANYGEAVHATKRALRAVAGASADDFATTVHAADSPDEARYLAEILLNPNYHRWLPARCSAALRPMFEQWLADYTDALANHRVERVDACIVGSAVLEVVGIRASTDIDCIVAQRSSRFHDGVVPLAKGVDLVSRGYHRRADGGATYTDDDVVTDALLHFHVRGLKVANPEIVIDRKRQHGRQKDLADVRLWERRQKPTSVAVRVHDRAVLWCEQEPDVMQLAALQEVADQAQENGNDLVVAGLTHLPVGAAFAAILRPVPPDGYPDDVGLSSADAIEVLERFGIDVTALLDYIAATGEQAAHPGVTRVRLAASAWTARWMASWLAKLAPGAVQIADGRTGHALIFERVAAHLGIAQRDVTRTLPGVRVRSVNVRAVSRAANETVRVLALASRAADAERRLADMADREAERAQLIAARASAAEAANRARLFRWALESRTQPIWIWGAGSAGRAAHGWLLSHGGRAAGVVDSRAASTSLALDGWPVSPPEVLAGTPAGAVRVLVASMHVEEIRAALDTLGIKPDQIAVWASL
jgi:hypothetical protein